MVIGRYLLRVPYRDKDRAKLLGARWDPVDRRWWIGPDACLGCFDDWHPEAVWVRPPRPDPPRSPNYGRTGRPVRTYR